jgi:hypothetical protein
VVYGGRDLGSLVRHAHCQDAVLITDLLLDAVGLLVDLLELALPSADLPFQTELNSVAPVVNNYLFAFDGLLPLTELVLFYRWVATVWVPGFLGYLGIKFVVAHLPGMAGAK